MKVALLALLGLFVLRVLGQLVLAVGWGGSWLPPWEEWYSGLLPYPWLLVSQLLIAGAYGRVCLDFWRGHGFFVRPNRALGEWLVAVGSVYLFVMVARYGIRMSLYPHERWTGGSLPIFFHWVLAAFVLLVGVFHRRSAEKRRPTRFGLAAHVTAGVLTVAGIAVFLLYQLAPTLLASALDARRSEYAVRIERRVPMTMADGVVLRADVYRPQRLDRAPAILVRIPFSKTVANALFATTVGRLWAERGYVVVIQGTRGRYESDGRHYPLRDERRDGTETLRWLSLQPWFDGRIGMWGGSAFGHTQWVLADQRGPGPAALMIQISGTAFHRMFYPGGAFSLRSALFWALRSRGDEDVVPSEDDLARGVTTLPLTEVDDRAGADVPFFNDWVAHAESEAYWNEIDGRDRATTLVAPVHLMAGWFDPFLPGQLDDFVRIRREARADVAHESRLVIGPWAHAVSVTFPDGFAPRNYRLESLAPSVPWFDRHLRGTQGSTLAPVRVFVMGANVWRDEQEWPLARARDASYYLQSGGRANGAGGDGRLTTVEAVAAEPADVFRYDPRDPVPTRGGAMLSSGSGIVRQNDVETRHDVLVYTSAPLERDLEVTGPVRAEFHVGTSVPNTDFTAKLVDVHADGGAYNVSDGILRRPYRPSGATEHGSTTVITIDLWPTSMVFRRGHRIRLEVSSSNFPRYDRNLNTGLSTTLDTEGVVATQAVHHGAGRPSRLVLPVVP